MATWLSWANQAGVSPSLDGEGAPHSQHVAAQAQGPYQDETIETSLGEIKMSPYQLMFTTTEEPRRGRDLGWGWRGPKEGTPVGVLVLWVISHSQICPPPG